MGALKLTLSSREIIIYAVLSTVVFSLSYAIGFYPIALLPFILPAILVIVKAPYIIFAGLFIAIPFSQHISVSMGVSTEFMSEQLMWLLCIMAFIAFLIKGKYWDIKYLMHPISLFLIAHLVWTAFTAFTSEMPVLSIKFLTSKLWFSIALFFCGLYFFKKKRMWKAFFWLTYISVLIIIGFIMVKHVGEGFTFGSINHVISPFFSNHVYYAATIVLFIPILFVGMQWYEKYSFRWWFICLGIVLFPIAAFLSYTRAAIVVMAAYPFIYLIFRFKMAKWFFILGIIVISLLLGRLIKDNNYLFYAPNYSQTISHDEFGNLIGATAAGKDISTMERVYRWVGGYHMIKEKPILGFGPGSFPQMYKDYTLNMFATYVSENKKGSGIHSYFFMVLVEQGIPGLLIFLALIYFVIVRGQKVYHRSEDKFSKQILLGFLVAYVGLLMLNMINDFLEVDKVASYFFWTMVVVILVDLKEYEDEHQSVDAPSV